MRELLAFTFGAVVISLVACARTADASTLTTLAVVAFTVGGAWLLADRH